MIHDECLYPRSFDERILFAKMGCDHFSTGMTYHFQAHFNLLEGNHKK
jgi:hypothetical protein